MAESKNVYVKIGQRGNFIEREADREIDHANLRALGFVLKGSANAPTEKDATYAPEPVTLADQPTSLRAAAEAAEADSTGGKPKVKP